MPGPFKVVWEFSQFTQGWTEQAYKQDSSVDSVLDGFGRLAAQQILRFRHPTVILQSMRVSDVTQPRSAGVKYFGLAGGGGPSLHPEILNGAVLFRLFGSNRAIRRNWWFRGLVAEEVVRDPNTGQSMLDGSLTFGLPNWIGYLNTNNYVIRYLTPINAAPYLFYRITQVGGAAHNPTCTISTPLAGQVIPTPQRVIISQVQEKLLPGFNGHYNITNQTATTFDINYSLPQSGPITITKGQVRIEAYQYSQINIDTSFFVRYDTRDSGRPPSLGRGRRLGQRIKSQ